MCGILLEKESSPCLLLWQADFKSWITRKRSPQGVSEGWIFSVALGLKGHYRPIALISHASKVMFKILQDRLQQYVNCELLHMFKLVLEKAEEPEDQIANIHWIIKKAREFQKKHLFLLY